MQENKNPATEGDNNFVTQKAIFEEKIKTERSANNLLNYGVFLHNHNARAEAVLQAKITRRQPFSNKNCTASQVY